MNIAIAVLVMALVLAPPDYWGMTWNDLRLWIKTRRSACVA